MRRRTYLGLDLSTHSFRAVALKRSGRGVELTGARLLTPDPEVVRFSARDTNILDRFRFVSQLREILQPLSEQEERIALSLPDCTGRMFVAEVETAFKTRDEGFEILKWHLKGSLPTEPAKTRLDFQPMGKTETGRQRFLVAAISSEILAEYEDAIEEAGFGATQIDFHAMNLFNYYLPRFNIDDAFVLVSVDGRALSLQYVYQGQIYYRREKQVAHDVESVFQEVSRTVVAATQTHAHMKKSPVFLHSDWEHHEALQQAIEGCFEKQAHLLEPRYELDAVMKDSRPQVLAAAIGAAERLF